MTPVCDHSIALCPTISSRSQPAQLYPLTQCRALPGHALAESDEPSPPAQPGAGPSTAARDLWPTSNAGPGKLRMKMMSVLRRPLYSRALRIVVLVGSMTACGSSDRLTSVDDSPGGLGVTAAQPVQPPSFSSTSLSGIPFGT